MFLLNIKKRQLLNYRDSSKIDFSKIGNVIMYRPDDVMKLLKKSGITISEIITEQSENNLVLSYYQMPLLPKGDGLLELKKCSE